MPSAPGCLAAALAATLVAFSAEAQSSPPVPKGVAGDLVARGIPVPLPQPDQKWIRAASPNFQIISSASEKRTREIAELLENVSGALRRVHPRFDAHFGDTTVFVFSRRRDSQPYFELLLGQKNTRAPGAFVAQADGSAAIIIDAERTLATDRTVKHELMHNILSSSGTRLPLWLEEGMAEYFSTTVILGDRVVVGRPIIQHQTALRLRGTLPMDQLTEAKRGSLIASHTLFYPQSWAIVDWMMRTNRQAFYAFVADIEEGMPVTDAFPRHYSIPAVTVGRSIRSLAMRPSASSATQIERSSIPISSAQIQYADALCEIGRFLGQMRSTREDAERHLQAALEAAPHHARATAYIGTLRAHQRRFDEAIRYFEEALEIDPGDAEIKTLFAQALLQNAIGSFVGTIDGESTAHARPRFHRARQLAAAALAAQPTPLREAILGTSYLVDDDCTPAIPHLEKARAARPARLDFAINLYAAYLRAGRRADAERLYDSVFADSHHPQAVVRARTVYVHELLLKANRQIEAGNLTEAAEIMKDAMAGTFDPSAKADLARQLENLERVAEANRQIKTYNDAVLAFNRHEHLTVVAILDTLLSARLDEAMRQKAEQLRNSARKRLGGM